MFRGPAMTYYGRWTYKYEIASEKGAAAAMIVHETGPAGYPYDVVKGSFAAEQFDVPSPDASRRVPVEGWVTLEKTRALLTAAGYDFDSLKAAAARKDFRPVVLNARASFDVKITRRAPATRSSTARSTTRPARRGCSRSPRRSRRSPSRRRARSSSSP
jgi:hypothetical protein